MPELKMKRITRADLIINGVVSADSIEFNSTDIPEKDMMREISERFMKRMAFRYNEKWVKK